MNTKEAADVDLWADNNGIDVATRRRMLARVLPATTMDIWDAMGSLYSNYSKTKGRVSRQLYYDLALIGAKRQQLNWSRVWSKKDQWKQPQSWWILPEKK